MKFDSSKANMPKTTFVRIGKRNAYHQAGHVAAIHFGNRQKNLPAVHFRLLLEPDGRHTWSSKNGGKVSAKATAKLEGGRLLPDLPCTYETATQLLAPIERQQCLLAFEADVINLLAGSLAEAKYVALRDDEVFNANLVYLGALKFYGGSSELAAAEEYMACLYPDNPAERKKTLARLFLAAYNFINDNANWLAITQLAEAIYGRPQDIFACEDLIELLELPLPLTLNVPEKLSAKVSRLASY